MSTASTTNLQERASSWRAVAGAEQIVKLLAEAANEPSTKRFNKSRQSRIERWEQLAELAQREATGLAALVKQQPRRPKVAKSEPPTATEAPAANVA